MTLLRRRLLPTQADNRWHGHRAALWLLGLFVALKLLMSINSILNTRSVAVGADGFPLHLFGEEAARAVLMLFALVSLGQLALALIALLVLIRYRALVPLTMLLLLCEQLARRLIVLDHAVARSGGTSAGAALNWGLMALLAVGLLLSLLPRSRSSRP